MRDNEREIFSNQMGGTYYIDDDLQKAMDEFEAFYGEENDTAAGTRQTQAFSPDNLAGEQPAEESLFSASDWNNEQPEEETMVVATTWNTEQPLETPVPTENNQAEDYAENVTVIVPEPSADIDEQFNMEDFGGIGMNDIYQSGAQNASAKPKKKKKGLGGLFRLLIAILICGVIAGAGYGVYLVKMKKTEEKKKEKEALTEVVTTEATTTEEPTTEAKYDGWIADAKVIEPVKTEKTTSLPAADLSVFEEQETEEGQTGTGEEEKPDPWTQVTLHLDSVEGSINHTSPGDPAQTTQLTSTYMVLVDLDTEEIVAERECDKVVPPASMTKILTVITARDYVSEENLDEKFMITQDIIDETNRSGLSAVGFKPDSEVTVRDLLYGTIVCSGADAAIGLARYCCGTEEAFVERMNENVEQLGLSETAHFTNPVGKYEEELHCTMKDMAVILNVAMQDELLRDVLSKRIYTTDVKYPDPEKEKELEEAIEAGTLPEDATVAEEDYLNIDISNWFLRRIEDKEMLGNVIGAKTGFVNKSGFCAASYYEANNGKRYICVTGNANSSWRAIYDHVGVYRSLTN